MGLFPGERVVSGMSLGKIACTGALKEPRESNFVGFTLLPVTVYTRPPTSDGHNFHARALF